jgi:serine/threonine protein kinase
VRLTAASLIGPSDIVSTIGAGGPGEMYRAREPQLGRDVAIKVLPPSFSAHPDRLRRFELEARGGSTQHRITIRTS